MNKIKDIESAEERGYWRGFHKGQADLIGKLKVEMTLAGWHEGMSIHQETEMGDYRRGQIDVMHWLERRQSESAGISASGILTDDKRRGKGVRPQVKNQCQCPSNPAPENALLKKNAENFNKKNHIKESLNKPENAFELGYCPTCNQMTNHIENQCQKCDSMNKPKPENAKKKRDNVTLETF